jgi:hypothetical protein
MCQLEPARVYAFLPANDKYVRPCPFPPLYPGRVALRRPWGWTRAWGCRHSYRLDRVRALCEKYQVTDALSWLLERMGDVPGAMRLLVGALRDKLALLLSAVRPCQPCKGLYASND